MSAKTDLDFSGKERIFLGKIKPAAEHPNLIDAQLSSYKKFIEERLPSLFERINPVDDNTGKIWRIEFGKTTLKKPSLTEEDARMKQLSYTAPLYVEARLINKKTGEVVKQELFVGEIPIMTPRGTFIISGNERVVVMQIVRSEGVIFIHSSNISPTRNLYMAQIMPERGAWITLDINKAGVITVKLAPRRPKILYTTLLRALGYSSDAEIWSHFEDIDKNDEFKMIDATLAKDKCSSFPEAVFEIYSKIRPDVSSTLENASTYLQNMLFNSRRLFLGRVGRYQLNRKLEPKYQLKADGEGLMLRKEDFIAVGRALLQVNSGVKSPDDMDHLANRRIRRVDELLTDHLEEAITRVEKGIKDKMSLHAAIERLTPTELVNTKPLIHAINEFFGTSAVSRYMNQMNIVAELANKRELTAGGPGGLSKQRATFSVRDVHYSHYSRICPLETPDGSSIGVVNHLALYSRINDFGFIEAPFRKVYSALDLSDKKQKAKLVGRICNETVKDTHGEILIKKGEQITEKLAGIVCKIAKSIKIKPYASTEVQYLTSDQEIDKVFAPASITLDEHDNFTEKNVPARRNERFTTQPGDRVDYIDVDPAQISGSSFALVAFAENTDPHRTLLSAGMVRQSLPLVFPEAPIVGTGKEEYLARESGYTVYAAEEGIVESAEASKILVNEKGKKRAYALENYRRTNDNTSINQRPIVHAGQHVKKGQLLADGPSVDNGEVSIGTNLNAAIMFYDGYNYEDGFVISERVIANDKFTNVWIHEYSQEVRETKLGAEETTSDIPNVSEFALRNLDKNGIVRVGAEVKPNDILVGIVAPKGEHELTAEERLLRAIFGEQARDVRDCSLRIPHGEGGVVINTQVLSKEKGDQLPTGTIKMIRVWVAKLHRLNLGDKISDQHAQKGVVCKVLPVEDMPHMADGTPVDVLVNPMFLKRMNVGLLKEMLWGKMAELLGVKFAVPQFSPLAEKEVKTELAKRGLEVQEKIPLYDGRTGERFDADIVVGPKYFLKLHHISEEKIHARSTGPYAIVTQQPLGGKAQFGGQRFGEMEVWALEAHSAPYALQEMLTIKSDDIRGRSQAYDAIVHGDKIDPIGVPEVLRVFITELRSLMLNPQPIKVINPASPSSTADSQTTEVLQSKQPPQNALQKKKEPRQAKQRKKTSKSAKKAEKDSKDK